MKAKWPEVERARSMVLEARSNPGFEWTEGACFPQIPRVQSVLYALRVVDTDHEGYMHEPGYAAAVHWVASIVCFWVFHCSCGDIAGEWGRIAGRGVNPKCLRPAEYEDRPSGRRWVVRHRLDMEKARRLIAAVIVELTPERAKKYDGGYEAAVEVLK